MRSLPLTWQPCDGEARDRQQKVEEPKDAHDRHCALFGKQVKVVEAAKTARLYRTSLAECLVDPAKLSSEPTQARYWVGGLVEGRPLHARQGCVVSRSVMRRRRPWESA